MGKWVDEGPIIIIVALVGAGEEDEVGVVGFWLQGLQLITKCIVISHNEILEY